MPNPKQSPDEIALREAITAVYINGTKKLSEYPPDQQQRIADYYRFSATKYDSDQSVKVQMSPDTLDIV